MRIPQHNLLEKAVDLPSSLDVPAPKLDSQHGRAENCYTPTDDTKTVTTAIFRGPTVTYKYATCFVERNPLGVIQDAVHRIESADENPATRRSFLQNRQQLRLELDPFAHCRQQRRVGERFLKIPFKHERADVKSS